MRDEIVAHASRDAPAEVAARARAAVDKRGNIADLLVEAGVAPGRVLDACCAATGLPPAPAAWLRDPKVPRVDGLDAELCRRLGCAPIGSTAGRLAIAYADPEVAVGHDTLGLPTHQPYLALTGQLARAFALLPEDDAFGDSTRSLATDELEDALDAALAPTTQNPRLEPARTVAARRSKKDGLDDTASIDPIEAAAAARASRHVVDDASASSALPRGGRGEPLDDAPTLKAPVVRPARKPAKRPPTQAPVEMPLEDLLVAPADPVPVVPVVPVAPMVPVAASNLLGGGGDDERGLDAPPTPATAEVVTLPRPRTPSPAVRPAARPERSERVERPPLPTVALDDSRPGLKRGGLQVQSFRDVEGSLPVRRPLAAESLDPALPPPVPAPAARAPAKKEPSSPMKRAEPFIPGIDKPPEEPAPPPKKAKLQKDSAKRSDLLGELRTAKWPLAATAAVVLIIVAVAALSGPPAERPPPPLPAVAGGAMDGKLDLNARQAELVARGRVEKDPKVAIKLFSQAIAMNPNAPGARDAFFERARRSLDDGDVAQAERDLLLLRRRADADPIAGEIAALLKRVAEQKAHPAAAKAGK